MEPLKPPQADVIIVAGYPANDGGTPSTILKERVDKAIELYRNRCAPYILMTGGAVSNHFIEAVVMRNYAISRGIDPSVVITETAATNTLENLRFSRQIMQSHNWHSAIIVSSSFHTRRIRLLCRKIGMDAVVIGTGKSKHFKGVKALWNDLKEWLLLLYYAIKTYQ